MTTEGDIVEALGRCEEPLTEGECALCGESGPGSETIVAHHVECPWARARRRVEARAGS